MLVAVSSSGKSLNSAVDRHFGRCPYYLIANVKNNELISYEFAKNEALMHEKGSGVTGAQFVINQGVKAVIASNMGPNAYKLMMLAGITVYSGTGLIKEVIKAFINNELKELTPSGRHHGWR